MAKCPMCGRNDNIEYFDTQFIDSSGKEYSVCSKCSAAIYSVNKNDYDADESKRYIKNCISECNDGVLRDWLKDVITHDHMDYAEEDLQDTTFWISNLKAINRVVFFVILIIGIVLFFTILDKNFFAAVAILAIAIVAAILVVGLSMVFLDIADDIRRIRVILERKNRN